MITEPTFNPAYRVAMCGQQSSHGPHVMESGPDQPRNCPGTGGVVPTHEQWRAAYLAKVADFARETERVSKLVAAIEAQGHTGRIDTRQFHDCPLCMALREVTTGGPS